MKCLESASDLAKAIALRRSLPRLGIVSNCPLCLIYFCELTIFKRFFCVFKPFLKSKWVYVSDEIHVELGKEIRSASDIFESAFDYNDNQNKAIDNALTLSFSLIQGPPGK